MQGRIEAPAAPAPVPSAELAASVEEASAALERAHAAFMADVPGTRSIVARAAGASRESDIWARAQVSLASLDSHRSEAAIALADLDDFYTRATLSLNPAEQAQVATARESALTKIGEEDRVLAELRDRMAR